jgi:NitT/TauT family transport system substrate-binding protein
MKAKASIKLTLLVILISALLLSGCAPQATPTAIPPTSAPAATSTPKPLVKITFRLSWTKEGTYASYYLAKAKGFYTDEGLDVTIQEGSGSGTSIQAVASGNSTFALADGTSVQGAVQEGTPVLTVATINQLSPYGVICRKDANVNSVADLVGKKVFIVGGSGEDLVFPAFLQLNNVDPSKVTVVNGDTSAEGPAVINGNVQCGVEFAAAFVGLLKQQAPDLQVNTIMFGENKANTVSQGIIASTNTVANHPDWVKAFVKATLRGNEYTVDHPDEAINALLKDSPDLQKATETDLLNAAISTWHANSSIPWGCSVATDWTFSEKLMVDQKVFSKTIPLDKYFTNQFVPDKCP